MERDIVSKIRHAFHKRGAWTLKTHGAVMQVNGLPDLICCYRGRFVGLEVKQPGGSATALQLQTLSDMSHAGALTGVVDSEEAALEVLDSMCTIRPLYELKAPEARVAVAERMVAERLGYVSGYKGPTISLETAYEVLMELGWGDAIHDDPAGPLELTRMALTLTDVQWCALSVAVAVVAEAGGGMKEGS